MDCSKYKLYDVPGYELVAKGLQDLAHNRFSTPYALLVLIASNKIQSLGIAIPNLLKVTSTTPSLELYQKLCATEIDPYSSYNALLRRLSSFCSIAETKVFKSRH